MIDIDGEPRSVMEILFAVGLRPCVACGSRELGALEVRGGGPVRIYAAPCRRCGARREVRFRVRREPGSLPSPSRFELGGPEPSSIIKPLELVEELERIGPTIAVDPGVLGPESWRANYGSVVRALTCLAELLKFDRSDPREWPERYDRAALELEFERFAALLARYDVDAPRLNALDAGASARTVSRGEVSSHTLEAHLQWVKRGRTGDGRLDVANIDLTNVNIGAKDLSDARLDGVVLNGADASFSTFERAELAAVRAVQANLGSCSFVLARLVRCDFLGANVALGKLDDAVVGGGRFDRAHLDRTLWSRAKVYGATFREADFGNARLDEAVFTDCDLRGASFSLRTPGLLGTTTRTRFERCDLRDTLWTGRDLDGTVFVECRFYGTSGQPGRVSGVRVERPDLSPAGDGQTTDDGENVLALFAGRSGG